MRRAAVTEMRLGDVAEIERDIAEPADIDTGTLYVGLEHIDGPTGEARPISVANGFLASTKHRFTKRHILYGKLRPYLAKIACPDFGGVCSTDIVPILPVSGLDRRFLFYFLRQPSMITWAAARAKGANLPRISPRDIEDMDIPLPPLPDQRRIAAILDKADALRRKRRETIRLTDDFLRSVFLDMFGDPVANPKGWPVSALGDLATRITKGESPKWQGFDYQDHGALFVTSENVRAGEIDISQPKFISLEFHRKLNRSELRPGDVLVNLVGASIGRSCIFSGYDGPANINQAVAVTTVDRTRVDFGYIAALLASEAGQGLLLGSRVESARANISLADLSELRIPVPPRKLQQQYTYHAARIGELKTVHRKSSDEIDALCGSLASRAFRGEL